MKKLTSKKDGLYIVWLMIFAYTIIFSYYTIMKHYTFQTAAYDLGIFLNSFYNTLHEGRFFYTTLWEGSRFENHFGPILFLILPIYAAIPKAETLLILQSFMLALGALPIYWIAKKEINKKAGVIFALLYLIYPALIGINRYDFHEIALAPVFILFCFHYYKDNRYVLSGIFAILALISREDVAMVILPMAVIWLWELKDKWTIKNKSLIIKDKGIIFCVSIIFISMVWFVVTTKFIIPMFNPEGYWFVKGYNLDFLFLKLNKKFLYIIELLLPLLFMPLFNKLMLPAVPIIFRNLLSNRYTRYQINNQHQALIIPFLFLSSIYFVKQASEYLDDQTKTLFSKRIVYPLLVISISISFLLDPMLSDIIKESTFSTTAPNGGPQPMTGIMTITPHDKALNQIIGMIPKNASIYVQSNLFSHMADRPKVYYVPSDRVIFKGWGNPGIALIVPWREVIDFEYILVDDRSTRSIIRHTDIDTLETIKENYGLYGAIDGIYLFKKGYNGTNNFLPSLLENFDNGFLRGYYNGIMVNYYNNDNLTGNPVATEMVHNISFKWGTDSPIPGVINNDNFSVKFNGYIYIPENGNYTFRLMSDDGSRLYIDNKLVSDEWESRPPIDDYYNSQLDIGLHRIVVDYRDKTRDAKILLKWLTPWKELEDIPEEYFYITKDDINVST